MKKNVFKTVIAAVCVVAAGMGGMKAYNTANQSEADMLLSENVEALSSGDYYGSMCVLFGCGMGPVRCYYYNNQNWGYYCWEAN